MGVVTRDVKSISKAGSTPLKGDVTLTGGTNITLTQSGQDISIAASGGSSPLTTKGDLYTYTTVDARLGVGSDGQVLTADSAQAAGIKWSTPAGGGDVVKVGTPVNNQVGVWTGDGTLEGDSALTFDTTTDKLSTGTTGVLETGTIELGHATDTTISRVSAGVVAIEGVNIVDVSSSQSLTNKKLGSLTSNGFVKTSGGDGTLSVDTSTYLTGNQTITLSGDVSGSGSTSITTTIGSGKVTEAMQVLADNVTQDVSTTKHGYVPKAPNDTTKFLRGDATWAVPTGGGISWTEVTGTSQSAAVDNGYIANNAGLVTVTLPDTAAVGKVIRVAGSGAGGWKVAQNASEQINFGNQATTSGTGGYLASTNRYDAVELICITANLTWSVLSSVGNITIV